MGGYASSAVVAASTSPTGDFDYRKHLLLQVKQQAYREETKEPDCSVTIRDPKCEKGILRAGIAHKSGLIVTIWDLWQVALKEHADEKCMGWRKLDEEGKLEDEYTWENFHSVGETVDMIISGLASLGVKSCTNVGIFSRNRPEWTKVMIGTQGLAARTVALYDTLGDEALEHILKQAEIQVLFTEKNKLVKLMQLLKITNGNLVSDIIVFDYQEKYGNREDALTEGLVQEYCDINVQLQGFTAFLKSGKKDPNECVIQPKGDDLCNIMYTSGTSGMPKGVMLSNIGVLCAVASASDRLEKLIDPNEQDIHFSYLPLAHIFELMVEIFCIHIGAAIGFGCGNIKKLAEDLTALRPTVFIGVPRIYGKFFEKFWAQVSQGNFLKKKIANDAFKTSTVYIRDNVRSGFYDTVLWNKVATKMGLNRCRVTITGAAPMPGYLMEFIKLVTSCPMLQGYGLTETTATGALSLPEDSTVGHIGVPPIACEIRLKDVPEMNYLHTDTCIVDEKELPTPRGEIEIRGEVVFRGYYKMKEKTTEVLDQSGWFSTGDIGRINPNGTISIIDRKKNIFKLSQGEYIAVEKVENQYMKSASLNQIWVYGNSHKSFIVAVVVPNAMWVIEKLGDMWTSEAVPASDLFNTEFEKLCTDNYAEVKKLVFEDMKQNIGKLKGFEKIRDIHMEVRLDNLLQGFNIENNCLTPSFKLKRPQLLARYTNLLKELYIKNGEAPQQGEKW